MDAIGKWDDEEIKKLAGFGPGTYEFEQVVSAVERLMQEEGHSFEEAIKVLKEMKENREKEENQPSTRKTISDLIRKKLEEYKGSTEKSQGILEKIEKLKTIASFMQGDFKIKELNKAVPEWMTILGDILQQEMNTIRGRDLFMFEGHDYFDASKDEMEEHNKLHNQYDSLKAIRKKLADLEKTLNKGIISKIRMGNKGFDR